MGLGSDIKNCDCGDNDLADDGGGADCDSGEDGFGSVSCSICLETVAHNGDRSWAKLQCGHQFHLDCIGSAFNAKGVMQCPNCRKIEKGQWLYANGCRSFPELNMEDWAHEEDIYDLGYSEMSFGVHWCPFGSLARLPSFEDGEFSPSSYHDLLGHHGFFTEPPGAASSAGHPCPYIAYFGPIHPSSSNSSTGISDSSNFNNHWNTGSSVTGEVPAPYGYPVDPHYHSWEYHSPPFSTSSSHVGSPTQPTVPPLAPRTSRTSSDALRPRPPHFMRPFLSHSSSARAGSSATSVPRAPPYPGSNARTRDRVQALQAYYQQSPVAQPPHSNDTSAVSRAPVFPSGRRSARGIASSQIVPVASSSDHQTSGFTRFNIWEIDHHHLLQQRQQQPVSLNQIDRDSVSSRWTAFHQSADGSGSFNQRHGS